MANLTPNEYFQAQFSDPKWVLIKAVRVDSPNTNWKKTVQPIVWLVKKDKKHAEFVSLWTNSYEADGTTYKKNTAPQQGYFQFNFTFEFSKSKDEMETFIADSVMQNEMIIQALSKEAGITDGPWSITQDPWDPNVVPKRLRPDTEPVAATGPSASTTENKSVTTTEPTVATSSVGASASNVGATASILGEFTFNVEQDNTFIGVNNQFGTLYTIGIGEIKEEPLAKPEEGEILEEEGLDEEYSEVAYEGPEEGAMAYPAAQVYQNNLMDSKREPDEKTTGGGKVISSTKFNGTPGAKLFKGHVKKDMLDDRVLFDIMIKAIEGGYYHPTHLPGNEIMANSGETLWGIDRYASTNENTNLGQKFWRIVDKLSGYGDLSGGGSDFNNSHGWAKDFYSKPIKRLGSEGNPAYYLQNGVILAGYKWGDVNNQPYARIHSTSKWDFKKRPPKSAVSFTKKNGVWGHCYSPNEKDYPNDYKVLRDAALEFGNNTKKANFDAFFKGYDELVNLINNDGRLKFLWLRSCWNGSGFFKNFAAGAKKAWDSGIKNADDLIVYDLNNRLVYASGLSKVSRGLITKDSEEIAGLIGL